mmetsp:Transcript_75045/g.219863  ORF Transcript_75045/g.219863 Transcript_75045/m.219863 type:complete len:83 (+) Transcript_75045:58-306(+)
MGGASPQTPHTPRAIQRMALLEASKTTLAEEALPERTQRSSTPLPRLRRCSKNGLQHPGQAGEPDAATGRMVNATSTAARQG